MPIETSRLQRCAERRGKDQVVLLPDDSESFLFGLLAC